MALSEKELDAVLDAQLVAEERERAVVYLLRDPVPAGSSLDFPQLKVRVIWDALLAFVDQEPLANWGHPCRYILIDRNTGAVQSSPARFPPFQRGEERKWRVYYQAPGVPDRALAVPK